ncbi:GNAT family N-acetyltransferase [Oscillospiraceae bacterium PP1C4]
MEKLRLRLLNDEDVELFAKWVQKDHVAKWYEQPMDWIDEINKRHSEFNWLHHYIVAYDDKDIGFCQYYEYKQSGEEWHGDIEINGTYSIDYLIGDTEYLRKGFGKAIVKKLMEMIIAEPNAERIIVEPDPDNAASCNTLLSAGFKYDEANKLYLFVI